MRPLRKRVFMYAFCENSLTRSIMKYERIKELENEEFHIFLTLNYLKKGQIKEDKGKNLELSNPRVLNENIIYAY